MMAAPGWIQDGQGQEEEVTRYSDRFDTRFDDVSMVERKQGHTDRDV